MKKSIAALLLAATMMFTGCSGAANTTTATEAETTTEATTTMEETTTTEETTTEETTTETTFDERMLKMSLDEVKDIIKAAYTDEEMRDMAPQSYDNGEHLEKDAEKGIKQWTRFGASVLSNDDDYMKKVHFIFVSVYEMDLNSEAFKALKVGDELSPMVFSSQYGYKEEKNIVAAINGQYVLTITEMYYNLKTKKLVTNMKAPYHFKNLENIIKSFEELKNT